MPIGPALNREVQYGLNAADFLVSGIWVVEVRFFSSYLQGGRRVTWVNNTINFISQRLVKHWLTVSAWLAIALLGAGAVGGIALNRGESVNSFWFIAAAVCIYALGYRFYSAFIAARVLALDSSRATPAERLNDGRDFVPTNKWIVFGHHFAAIAGPGPLIGPTLAAQFGYLPGTLWILVGAVLGGCVQDFVTLFFSTRRDGRSLGQMARDELGPVGGAVALIGVMAIMIILNRSLGTGGCQCHETQSLGHQYGSSHHPDRAFDRRVHARYSSGPGARRHRDWGNPARVCRDRRGLDR